tara:strand:+ start:673 stop:933 length:261 start_codon:yes stop_codon:yes gene_type:complete
MNERIKQLAEQAGLVKILEQHAHEYGAGTFENTPYPELEKFVELIVRECADVCYHHSWAAGGEDTAFGYGYKDCGDDVKQHFGVEL